MLKIVRASDTHSSNHLSIPEKTTPGHRVFLVLGAFTVGVLLAILAFIAIKAQEQRTLDLDFERREKAVIEANSTSAVRQFTTSNFSTMESLRRAGGETLSFDQRILEAHSNWLYRYGDSFRSFLLWVPRRLPSEPGWRPEGWRSWRGSRFHLNQDQSGPGSSTDLAHPRNAYPVSLTAPRKDGGNLVGVDLGSEPLQKAVMEWCCLTGTRAIVARYSLDTAGENNEWLYFLPVYGSPARATRDEKSQCSGFVVLLTSSEVSFVGQGGVESVLLEEPSDPVAAARAFQSEAFQSIEVALAEPSPVHRQHFKFGDTRWFYAGHPRPVLALRHESPAAWAVLIGGLLGSVLLSSTLLQSLNRSARVEALVTQRTAALAESEERFKRLFQYAPDPFYLLDPQGRFLDANRATTQLLGIDRDQMLGVGVRDLAVISTESAAQMDVAIRQLQSGSELTPVELTLSTSDGRRVVLEIRTVPVHLNDEPVVLGIARDITERKRAEEALRESEERYALAARGANDGLFDWDRKGQQIYFSPRWKEMLGFAEEEVGDGEEEWFGRVHPEDLNSLLAAIEDHLANQSPYFENEHRIRDRNGNYHWMLARGMAVRDEHGAVSRIVGSQTEVTKRRMAEQQLRYDARHDALTGLPNRSYFMDQLEKELHRTQSSNETFAVFFIDIDRFKLVNDSLGHLIGDQLLTAIAKRLKGCIRPSDMVARLGGDEFTLLAKGLSDLEAAEGLARRIQHELAKPLDLEGHEVVVTASIGVTMSTHGYSVASNALRDADMAMYRAKLQGRARYEIFTRDMRYHAIEKLQLETDLRRALERKELHVVYQPIVEMATGRICGFEALLRWHHSNRGLVPTDEFIRLAEETDLIVPFGTWILGQACRQAKAWLYRMEPEMAADFSVSVNVSSRQLKQHDFAQVVARKLEESRLSGHHLKLEITESMIIDEARSQMDTISNLKKLGARLLIDDFGTGYSSLHYLHRFDVEALKIDRIFVDTEIVGAIVTLAHNLGIGTIAEGVETQEQVERLSKLGCCHAQGFYFSPPVSAEEAEMLIFSDELLHREAIVEGA